METQVSESEFAQPEQLQLLRSWNMSRVPSRPSSPSAGTGPLSLCSRVRPGGPRRESPAVLAEIRPCMAAVIGGSVFPPVDLTPARVLGLQKSVAASFSFRNMLSLRLLNEVSPIRSDAANVRA